jgi:hypothetical protein
MSLVGLNSGAWFWMDIHLPWNVVFGGDHKALGNDLITSGIKLGETLH